MVLYYPHDVLAWSVGEPGCQLNDRDVIHLPPTDRVALTVNWQQQQQQPNMYRSGDNPPAEQTYSFQHEHMP